MSNLWWLVAGLAFMASGLPLIYQKVPPNHWYGFRVPKTLSNPRIWYAANRIAGIDLLLAGVVIALTAILTTLMSLFLPAGLLAALNFTVFAVALALTVIHSFWVLAKL